MRCAAGVATLAAGCGVSSRTGAETCPDGGRCKSTCTAFEPGWTAWWASPATTSTSSGGSTVLVAVIVGPSLGGLSLDCESTRGTARGCVSFFRCTAALGGVVTGEGVSCVCGGDSGRLSASSVSGNQKSRSRYRTATRETRSNTSATSINRRCRGELDGTLPGRRRWPCFGTPAF